MDKNNITTLINPGSRASEAYRALKAYIKLSFPDNKPKIIAVTSAEPGDGRTKTCVNLAVVMAEEGSSTLLIDFDLRNPRINEIFNIYNEYGISALEDSYALEKGIIIKSNIENLYLLTSGGHIPDPWKVFESVNMKEIFSSLKVSYKYIIIDTPPVNSYADAQLIGQYADGCIMVVACNKTNREAAAKAKCVLEKFHIRILGVVFNKNKVRFLDYLYRILKLKL